MNVEDYTQHPLSGAEGQGPGVYRVFPVAWTVEPSTKEGSSSVAVAFRFAISRKWHGKDNGGWSQEWPPGYYVEGRSWVVKADGSINAPAVEALAKAGLWNGEIAEIEGPPRSVFVLVDVEEDSYEGKIRYRANWINPDADEPRPRGGFAPQDPNVMATLRARFGGQLRAVAGGKPAGTPAPPPSPALAAPAHAPAPAAPIVAPPVRPVPAPMPGAPAGQPPAVRPPTAQAARPAGPPQIHPPTARPAGPPAITPGFAGPPASGDADDPVDPGETPF